MDEDDWDAYEEELEWAASAGMPPPPVRQIPPPPPPRAALNRSTLSRVETFLINISRNHAVCPPCVHLDGVVIQSYEVPGCKFLIQ